MASEGLPEKLMIPYLLGELSEEDQIKFERACLDDDQLFEELMAVEAELTDDYVRGDLVGIQRAAFEKRSLNSLDGGMRELAQLIAHRNPSPPQPRAVRAEYPLRWLPAWLSTPVRFVPVSAVTILIIGIGLFWWKNQPSQSFGNRSRSPQQASIQKPDLPPPDIGHPDSSRTPVLATFVIVGGGERDTGLVNEVTVPDRAERVRLQLDVRATQHTSYHASLKKIGQVRSSSLPDPRSSGATDSSLTIEMPAADLPAGDSILTVTSARDDQASPSVIGNYFIRRLK